MALSKRWIPFHFDLVCILLHRYVCRLKWVCQDHRFRRLVKLALGEVSHRAEFHLVLFPGQQAFRQVLRRVLRKPDLVWQQRVRNVVRQLSIFSQRFWSRPPRQDPEAVLVEVPPWRSPTQPSCCTFRRQSHRWVNGQVLRRIGREELLDRNPLHLGITNDGTNGHRIFCGAAT